MTLLQKDSIAKKNTENSKTPERAFVILMFFVVNPGFLQWTHR
jgi:hypothetical protein